MCRIPPIKTHASVRHKLVKDRIFAVSAPELFNCIPIELIIVQLSLESFKLKLDKLVGSICEHPSLPGYPQLSASNAIFDKLAASRVMGSSVN